MKPKIFKLNGTWILFYAYHARSFTLFGLNAEERKQVKESLVETLKLSSWQDCIKKLNQLYKDREIRFIHDCY